MSIRSVIETVILLFAILLGAIFNVESKMIIYEFLSDHQSIAAAIIGSIIASTIIVLGLFCAYYFNNKVQDQRVKKDITNIARKEITEALKEYQKNLSEINHEISRLNFFMENDVDINWQENLVKYRNLFYSVTNAWNETLEDYQIIFPETRNVIIQLQHRDHEIANLLTEFHRDLIFYTKDIDDKVQVKVIIEKANITIFDYIVDQIGLIKDLRIYLQNCSLCQITGNNVAERQPLDPSTPKIIMNIDTGFLEIDNNVVTITQMGEEILKSNKKTI